MRTQAEWNVDTHIALTTGPTSWATRSRISAAALLVNVIARMLDGATPWSIRWAIRCVSTRVLPDPAPATTSSGPSRCTTASSWSGLSPTVKGLGTGGSEVAGSSASAVWDAYKSSVNSSGGGASDIVSPSYG